MALVGKRITIQGADFTDVRIDTELFTLDSIAVTTNPTKMTYAVGEYFDPEGMVVTATLIGNVTATVKEVVISNYTYEPLTPFDVAGSENVTVSYTRNEITKTAVLPVTVTSSTVYSITSTITNGTVSGDTSIIEGDTATVTITPSSGYTYPAQGDIVVVNASINTYNQTTGELVLESATDDVTITTTCPVEVAGEWLSNILMGNSTAHIAFNDPASYSGSMVAGADCLYTAAALNAILANKRITKVAVGARVSSGSATLVVELYDAINAPSQADKVAKGTVSIPLTTVGEMHIIDVTEPVAFSAAPNLAFDFAPSFLVAGYTDKTLIGSAADWSASYGMNGANYTLLTAPFVPLDFFVED